MTEAANSSERDEGSLIDVDEETFKYIENIVPRIARKIYPGRIERDDLIQIVLTIFVNKPPVWKPSSGAARKTFIYRCVYCDLINAIDPTRRDERGFRRAPNPEVVQHNVGNSHVEDGLQSGDKPSDYIAPKPTEAEILEHIEGEEDRRLCSAYIKHSGNAAKTAKEVGVSDRTGRRSPGLFSCSCRGAVAEYRLSHRWNVPAGDHPVCGGGQPQLSRRH